LRRTILKKDTLQRYNTIEQYGKWLEGYSWSHYATCTTGYEMTLPSARRAMHKFHDLLDKAAPCKMFWAAEPFDVKDGYHTHVLLDVNSAVQYKNIVDLWQKASGGQRLGKWQRIDLQDYDSTQGATKYLSKYVTKRLSDFDFLTAGSSRGYFSQMPKIRAKERL
jgi:hypothetical protein